MKVKEIMQILEEQSPLSYACGWDNSGLLAGSPEKEVQKVYIALDASDEAVDEAVQMEADLLLTHHPLIFNGIKKVTTDDFIGRRLIKMIQNDMSYIAMHTNFDVKGMADLAAARLGLQEARVLDVTVSGETEEGFGRVGLLMEPVTLAYCAEFVKAVFGIEHVKVFGDMEKMLRVAAVSPGSGKCEIEPAIANGADVLITGDIDHHDGIDAAARGLCIIDAGHYGLEHIFTGYMKKYLEMHSTELTVMAQETAFPYKIV